MLIGISIYVGASWCEYCDGFYCDDVQVGGSGWTLCNEYHGKFGDMCTASGGQCYVIV